MQGADVRKAREALGWKRPELATKTGLSVAQIASIETGRLIRPGEESVLREVLQERLATAPVGNGKEPAAQPAADGPEPMPPAKQDPTFDTGVIVLEEWGGMVQGDVVRIKDDPKPWEYEFIKYVKQPSQEYVVVQRKGRASPRNVRPDNVLRLVIVKRRRTWEEVTDAVQDA